MAKVTWLGEDELHGDGAGPSFTRAFGMKFPKGEAVEVTDGDIVARASKNLFFRVEREEEDELAGLTIAELRDLATAKGIDSAGMSKPQLREALRS